MGHYALPLLVALSLTSCDGEKAPVEKESEVRESVGTFTALINGRPWTAQASFSATTGDALSLRATYALPNRYPLNEELSILVIGTLKEGSRIEMRDFTLQDRRMFFSENQGDGVVQGWRPLLTEGGALSIVRLDSAAGILRATLSATLVSMLPHNVGIQRNPDTLRITQGVFEIALNRPVK